MTKRVILLFISCFFVSAAPNGAEIFKKCAICHGDQAQKHSLNVSKIIAGMDAKDIIEKLKQYQSGTFNQYGYGKMMQGQATKLDDAQMQAVATYVSMLKVTDPVKEKSYVPKNESDLTPEELEYKAFIQNFFKENPNPNASLREADRLWEERQKNKK